MFFFPGAWMNASLLSKYAMPLEFCAFTWLSASYFSRAFIIYYSVPTYDPKIYFITFFRSSAVFESLWILFNLKNWSMISLQILKGTEMNEQNFVKKTHLFNTEKSLGFMRTSNKFLFNFLIIIGWGKTGPPRKTLSKFFKGEY